MKAVQFANDGLEEIKRSAVEEGKKGPEEMGVVTLRKAVGEEKGKGVGLEAEVATLKKALEEACGHEVMTLSGVSGAGVRAVQGALLAEIDASKAAEAEAKAKAESEEEGYRP